MRPRRTEQRRKPSRSALHLPMPPEEPEAIAPAEELTHQCSSKGTREAKAIADYRPCWECSALQVKPPTEDEVGAALAKSAVPVLADRQRIWQ